MKPLELLNNKKYRNIENLISAVQCNTFNSATLDLIENSESATIYYLLIQFEINIIKINELCNKYVYDTSCDNYQFTDLINLKNTIIKNHRLTTALLNIPINLTRDRLQRHLTKLSNGYHTYGDFEGSLSLYLSPFFTLNSFSDMLNISRELIENIDTRYMLTDYLKDELDSHFKSIELEITVNQKIE